MDCAGIQFEVSPDKHLTYAEADAFVRRNEIGYGAKMLVALFGKKDTEPILFEYLQRAGIVYRSTSGPTWLPMKKELLPVILPFEMIPKNGLKIPNHFFPPIVVI